MSTPSFVSTTMSAEAKHHEGFSASDAASRALASLGPIGNIDEHLCGFHISAQDRTRHVEAHHFCNRKDTFSQCVIYDSEDKDARLIGVEYIVDENVFKSLPEEEKKYWHSHKYEVESGLLYLETKAFVPNVVNDHVEQRVMRHYQRTYGKTVHTWAIDKYPELPLGPPQLMMTATGDSQLNDQIVQERDNRLGISTESKRKYRASYLDKYEKDEEADQWERSDTGIAFEPREVKLQA